MTTAISPDCRVRKHPACNGGAWDHDTDQPADCSCDCHTRDAALAEVGVHVLRFEYSTKPIDLNGSRGSHRAHARKVREVKDEAAWRARAARLPHMDRIQVGLFWFVRTGGRRDSDNLGAVAKAMVDGLVLAGVISDDNDDIVERHQPRIVHVDPVRHAAAWMELVVAPADFTWTKYFRSVNR